MTEPLSRDAVIELLNSLGSDRDEDVLAAAREVHARIVAVGMTWEDLLVPDGSAADADAEDGVSDAPDDDDDIDDDIDDTDDDDDDTDDADDIDDDIDDAAADDADDDADDIDDDDDTEAPDLEDEDSRPTAKAGAKHLESIALIDKLLAKSHISTDLREELKGYKADIAAGEFEDRDRRYISAISARLSTRR